MASFSLGLLSIGCNINTKDGRGMTEFNSNLAVIIGVFYNFSNYVCLE